MNEPARPRRKYDSPLRRQQAADTYDRIVAAGVAILHEMPLWKWQALTVRAVAQRAGVTERTVYRHFATERELRELVMARLEEEAGVDIEDLVLDDLEEITSRLYRYVSSFPLEPRTPPDPALASAGRRLGQALLGAVARDTEGWSEDDRTLAAAMLDVLWSLVAYERLVGAWELDPDQAVRGVIWVMGLVQEAIRDGRRPGDEPPGRS
jgi:AcrR family transcriptional regulator